MVERLTTHLFDLVDVSMHHSQCSTDTYLISGGDMRDQRCYVLDLVQDTSATQTK